MSTATFTARNGHPRVVLTGVLFALAAPGPAAAHLVTSGVGPFYDGVAHLFVSPEDVIVVIALAMLGGLYGLPAARHLVLTLPAAWLAGAALGINAAGQVGAAWLPAAGMLISGLLLATHPRLPVLLPAVIAGAIGLLHGFLNGRTIAATRTPILAAVGIVTAVSLVTLLLAALTSSLRVPWQRIAVRVLGSWVGAIGLLSLAWALRPTA